MPPDPPEPFFILNILKDDSARKNTLQNVAILGAPFLKKILEQVANMEAFSKGFLCLCWVQRLCI